MTFLIILYLIIFTAIAWKRLDWAVLFIIAGTPLYLLRFNILGIPSTLIEAMILITFTIWLIFKDGAKIKTIFKKTGRTPYPYRFEIMAVLVISWLAIITAGISNEALGTWKAYFFEPLLLFILIINLLPKEDGRKKIILALAASALIVSLLAIYQKISGQFIANPFWAAEDSRRVVSFFGYPNAVALFLAPMIMIFAGQFLGKISKYEKLFFGLSIFSSLLAIIFAKSEGALVGLMAGSLIFALFINKKIRLITIILTILSSLFIISYLPLRHFALEKITLNDLSGQIRKQQWIETKKMMLGGRLLSGVGLSNYQKAVAPYHQEGVFLNNGDSNWLEKIRNSADFRRQMWQPTEIYMYPHNILLNFWSELGILGVLLFCWIIAKFLWQSGRLFIKEKEVLALGLSCSMVVIVVHGLVDVPYFKNDLSLIFWISIALLSSLNLKSNEKNSTEINC